MRSTLTTRTVDGNRLLQSKHSTHHIVLVSSTCTKGVSYAHMYTAARDVDVTTHSGVGSLTHICVGMRLLTTHTLTLTSVWVCVPSHAPLTS